MVTSLSVLFSEEEKQRYKSLFRLELSERRCGLEPAAGSTRSDAQGAGRD